MVNKAVWIGGWPHLPVTEYWQDVQILGLGDGLVTVRFYRLPPATNRFRFECPSRIVY